MRSIPIPLCNQALRTSAGIALLVMAGLALPAGANPAPVHHDLRVRLDPTRNSIEAEDRMRFIASPGPLVQFELHSGLHPTLATPGARLEPVARHNGSAALSLYRLHLPTSADNSSGPIQVTLRYHGTIQQPPKQQGEGYGRGFQTTPGHIGPEGVFLGGGSYWYPVTGDDLVSFRLQIDLPTGWDAVSQGKELSPSPNTDGAGRVRVVWEETHPQEEVYLLAGPLHRYRKDGNGVRALAYLREPDAQLARRYLQPTLDYIALYSDLIGPYPYRKFALVENFWETGYGMPSFTALGPRVLRLPFIVHTSYPHEVLHNWWGNGVYVDFAGGNWSEGLTNYLADHLLRERKGQGAAYRRTTLKRYLDFVTRGRDFPLADFRGRHGPVSQAVGYGKGMMVFHMLRRRLGDQTFFDGLRRFYRLHLFQRAGWADLQRAFEAESGEDLGGFFHQWLQRSGAPALHVDQVRVTQEGDSYRIRARLEQTQAGPAYSLRIPVTVELQGLAKPYETVVTMGPKDADSGQRPAELPATSPGTATLHSALPPTASTDTKRANLDIRVTARPLRLLVDPRFDLFRRLDRREIPASLSQVLGADRPLAVLPATAPEPVLDGYRAMVQAWQGRGQDWEVVLDRELATLPGDRSVWLFGWDNRFLPNHPALHRPDVSLDGHALHLAGMALERDRDAVVMVDSDQKLPGRAIAWLGAADPTMHPGLTRKLPHYGKYGWLAFRGEGPRNVGKGEWRAADSPLWIDLP